MDTSPSDPPIAASFLGQILGFFPVPLRAQLEGEASMLSLAAARLGLEVLEAEQRGIGFSAAVERSAEFPLMGRVYFGARNLLQWQIPSAMRDALRSLLTLALEGQFDSMRKLLFLIAQRKRDPEAALCRFLLWAAVRINLVILTWHQPQVEATEVFDAVETRTEEVLRGLLDGEEIHELDCRPLHMLVAQVLHDIYAAASPLLMGAMTELESEMVSAFQMVRGLEARDAALFQPGRFTGSAGSPQILDRFPQHEYASTSALELQRSRIRKRADELKPTSDRVIDLILQVEGGAR